MAKLSNIDAAYEYLKTKKDSAEFNEIWNAIAGHINADNEQKPKLLANLYSELVLDNRFSLTSDGKWALRSNMNYEDVKKHYDYVTVFDLDQDFDDLDDTTMDDVDGDSKIAKRHDDDTHFDISDADLIEDEDDDGVEVHFEEVDDEDSYGDGDDK